MWLFTQYGFYSVTEKKGCPYRVQIRARVREHLDNLRKRFQLTSRIRVGAGTDYRYRLYMSKEQWALVAAGLAREIDYDNFKDWCRDSGKTDFAYDIVLHQVWSIMARLQEQEGKEKLWRQIFP